MADSSSTDYTSAGAGAGSSLGALLGYFLTQGQRNQILDQYQQALQNFSGLNPNIQGQTSQASLQGPSAYNSLSVNPEDRANQMQALSQLQSIYKRGGMDAQAKASMAQAQQAADQNAQAMNSALKSSMAQRGLSSSGASFSGQRANQQTGANAAALANQQAAAAGEQRAMNALESAGSMASQMHQQDYNEAAQRAAAQDAIARFNAGLSTQNNQFNAGQLQRAEEQTFNNALGKAGGQLQGTKDLAGAEQGQASQLSNFLSGALGGAGSIGGSALSALGGGGSKFGGGDTSSTDPSNPYGGSSTDMGGSNFTSATPMTLDGTDGSGGEGG